MNWTPIAVAAIAAGPPTLAILSTKRENRRDHGSVAERLDRVEERLGSVEESQASLLSAIVGLVPTLAGRKDLVSR